MSAAFWTKTLTEADIPTGPVYTLPDVFGDPHVQHGRILEELYHSTLGRAANHRAPPVGGQHDQYMSGKLSNSWEEIEALVAAGIVVAHDVSGTST